MGVDPEDGAGQRRGPTLTLACGESSHAIWRRGTRAIVCATAFAGGSRTFAIIAGRMTLEYSNCGAIVTFATAAIIGPRAAAAGGATGRSGVPARPRSRCGGR